MKNVLRLAMVIGVAAGSASADVLVAREVKSDGFQGIGASSKVTQTWISGLRHREEDKTNQKDSSFLGRLAAGEAKAVITRLDKKLIWNVFDQKKKYEEVSLIAPAPTVSESKDTGDATDPADGSSEKPTTRISKAEFKVVPTGQSKTLSGFPCKQYVMTAMLETEDLASHEKSRIKMVTTLWATPETGTVAKLKQEEEAYAKRYVQTLGGEASGIGLKALGTTMIAGLMGSGEKELTKALAGLPAEMKKIQGYPIETRVQWLGEDDTVMFGMTATIRSISTDNLGDAPFEVPAGYKKIS